MPKRKPAPRIDAEDWMSRVRDSSHDVVLAGLASLARACSAGDKPAKADFKTLVTEGRGLEPELQEAARKAWRGWVERPGHGSSLRAGSKLHEVFDERVSAALARLGVPSGEEIAELRAKVERLLDQERLTARPAAKGRKRSASRQRSAAGRRARVE